MDNNNGFFYVYNRGQYDPLLTQKTITNPMLSHVCYNDMFWVSLKLILMQSYPPRILDRTLQEDWARATKEDPRVLMNLRVDF